MIHFQGVVYRAHDPCWSFNPLSGDGAAKYGGRFNEKDRKALYTSLNPSTSFIEYQQGFLGRPQPVTICAYEVDCENIVDLTSQNELKKYNIKKQDLDCNWEILARKKQLPPSWKIIRGLINTGAAGIIVPSYAFNSSNEDKNLVFWKWGSKKPHQLKLIDHFHKLPKNNSSWT